MLYGGRGITGTNFFVAFSLLLFGANFDMEDIFYKILPLFIALNLIKIASFIFAQILIMYTYKKYVPYVFFCLNFVKMACPHGPCLVRVPCILSQLGATPVEKNFLCLRIYRFNYVHDNQD